MGPILLLSLMVLSACAPPAETAALPSGERGPSRVQIDPPEPVAVPSVVERLALDRVQALGLAGQGEETVRAAYRWLVEQVYFADPVGLDSWRYLSDDDTAIPYLENRALSPLLFGIGSCEDFAAAMVMLLRAAGFEADYVAGYTLSVEQVYIDHAWAVVKLDGRWYHLDPQLEQNVSRGNRLAYRYYLRSDGELELDHKWGENLIAHWPEMPEEEKAVIRTLHTPPPCPRSGPRPQPETIPPPPKPNMAVVEAQIDKLRAESQKGTLPPIHLNVEPPVLVAARHVTPPLPVQAVPYGRSLLVGEAAGFYDRLLAAVEGMEEPVAVPIPPGLSGSEAKAVSDTLLGDWPACYWVEFALTEQGRQLQLTFFDSLTRDGVREQQRRIQAEADRLLAQAVGSQLEIVRYIHDYLAGEIAYDQRNQGENSGNIYGALVEGAAFCDGYAKSFQYLTGLAGLECAYIKGSSLRGIPHAWNAVRLADGWRYVDVTWDRPTGAYDGVYHDYFLVSLEEMSRERSWDEEQYLALPPSDSRLPGYYEQMGYTVGTDADDKTAALADVFFRQLSRRTDFPSELEPVFLELKVLGDGAAFAGWKELYIKQVFYILQAMEQRARLENQPFTVSYDTSVRCDFNDVTQVLTFYPKVKLLEE